MAKKYIDAELRIVRISNNIIATSTMPVGDPFSDEAAIGAPGRHADYDFDYSDEYDEDYDY
ncbi:MAG: hypothetical protein MJZ89_05975 [Paludibacteraceae bacterium]|nr:hypothetical protein [Paludibacteraceae bacterium]